MRWRRPIGAPCRHHLSEATGRRDLAHQDKKIGEFPSFSMSHMEWGNSLPLIE
jgi:hypothetical protein